MSILVISVLSDYILRNGEHIMLDLLGVLVGLCLPFAIVYYFIFGGKEKLATHLFNKMSLAGKVEKIIKRDLSAEYARATFYIINDYSHKMCQADWQKFCQERIDPSLDKNSPEYAEAVAPIMNAIVVNEGYYLRRGMEDMSRKLVRFMPGVNDMISLNYFVEPYKYVKNHALAAKSLAEEEIRQKKYEEDAPARHAAYDAQRRCKNCANYSRCDWQVRQQTGPCGGYTPK